MQTRVIPLSISLGLHALVAIVLLWGFPVLSPQPAPAPQPIVQARVVALEQSAPAAKPQPKPRPAPKPAPKPKPVAPAPDPAEARQREARIQEQRRLEQRRIEEQKEAARQEQARQEAEQRRLEEQRQQELQRRRELLTEAAAEESARIQAERDGVMVASFTSVIERAIIANWSRPASARNNMQAELVIQLIPTGEVVNVAIARSSGNAAFDRSAENAVLRAARFPELQQLPNRVFEQNFRRFRLIFRPEDLRR